MRPLRLALVTRRYWPLFDGGATATCQLASEFLAGGHSVRIVTAQLGKQWPLEVVHREIPVTRLVHPRTPAWGTLRFMFALSRWLRQEKNNLDAVIVSRLRHEAYCLLGAAAGSPLPIILRAETAGIDGEADWQTKAQFGSRIRLRCQQASKIIVTGEQSQTELLAAGYDSAKLVRIDNGIRLPPARSPLRAEAARRVLLETNYDLQSPQQGPIVVADGRLLPEKGLADLVKAFSQVYDRLPTARLWIVGEGPQRDTLFGRIVDLGLKYVICLPGAFDDLDEVLQAADLFVSPALQAGTTNALLEALAAGVPTIATDLPAHRALIVHQQTGLLVPAKDPATLATSLIYLLENRAEAIAMGAKARVWIAAERSAKKMAEEHLQVILSQLDN